jgi:predicted ATPase/DNA-binding SARP family transcriptional activator
LGDNRAVDIRLLGPLQLRVGDLDLLPARPKQRLLLALLAVNHGEPVSTDALIEALWGNAPPPSATNALHGHVTALRKLVGGDRIETRAPGYLLRVEPGELDVERFESLIHEARGGDAPERRLALVDEALGLVRGTPLADFRYDAFAQSEIARLEELRLVALAERSDALLELGEAGRAVPELQRLVAADPFRERFAAQLMLALYRSGRQVEALDVFRIVRRRFVDDLGLEPGPELRGLNRSIIEHDPALGVPERAVTALPPESSRFVGRERELGDVMSLLLAADGQIVTLTGPAGTGKTRLALRVARLAGLAFPGGAAFVELAPVRDAAFVVATIAQALGVPDAVESLLDALVVRLAATPMLLVLDNFEHVQGAATDVERLAADCPGLSLLVTSRTPLQIARERELMVEPLEEDAAVELFVERAQDVRPDFHLGSANESSVRELCRRLDGLPLAIELTAPRVRTLPPEAILERLAGRLDLEAPAAAGVDERHRTLRRAIAWSHDLVGDDARVVFRRLGIFRGGCSATAAEEVCGFGGRTPELMTELVEHNLLRLTWGSRGEPRFQMLDSIWTFAVEQLEASDEFEVIARRHVEHYVDFGDRKGPDLKAPEPLVSEVFAAISAETDNFRAVHEWSLAHNDPRPGMRIIYDLWLWYFTWWLGEGRDWAERLLAADQERVPPETQAGAAYVAAVFSWALGDVARIAPFAEMAAATSREAGDSEKLALAYAILAGAYTDDPERGRALLAAGDEAAAASGDAWTRAFVSACASLFAVLVGDGSEAVRHGQTAMRQYEAIGGTRQLDFAQLGVGLGLLLTGELELAAQTLEENFENLTRMANWKLASMAALGAALTARLRGDLRGACDLYEQAYWVAEQGGDRSNIPLCLEGVAATTAAEEPTTAARLLGAARAAYDSGRVPTMPGFEAFAATTQEVLAGRLGSRLDTLLAEGARGRNVPIVSRAPAAVVLAAAETRSPRELGAARLA